MGNFQYVPSTSFFAYTPTASSSAASYPATRLGDWDHTRPLVRTWRSQATSPQALSFNFGTAKTGTWMAILNANFTSVQVGVSTDNITFTDAVTGSGTLVTRTMTQDLQDPEGFTKLFLPVAYSGKQYGRLEIPTQTPTDGASYFKIGAVMWGSALVTMSHGLHAPITVEHVSPEYVVEGKDWREATPAGINYATISIHNTFRYSESPEWNRLRLLPPGSRLLAYFNADDPSETYLCEKNKPITFTRHGIHQEIDAGLRILS
jgi:hypothetical protein